MFKRILIGSTLAACLLSNAAFAGKYVGYKGEEAASISTSHFRPYVGVNFMYLHTALNNSVTETVGAATTTFSPRATMPADFTGFSVDSGFRYGKYVGMEFGYYETGNRSKSNGTTTTTLRPKGGYVDFRAYLPIDQFDLIGIAGFGIHSLGDAKVVNSAAGTTTTLSGDDTVTPRLGAGVAYNFNENWGVRATAKYSFSHSRYIDSAYTVDAGIYYNFTF